MGSGSSAHTRCTGCRDASALIQTYRHPLFPQALRKKGTRIPEEELQRIMAHASISGRNMLDYQVGEGRVG